MSEIRCIYHGSAPDFPASDQHPEAVRYGPITLSTGQSVYVDAIGGPPTVPEIERVLATRTAVMQLDAHLAATIAEFSPPKQGAAKMRGLARLADLVENGMKELDDDADKAVEEFLEAKAKGKEALGNFRGHTAEVRKKIDDALQQLGRISNMDPTQGSGGSSGSTTGG